MRKFYKILIMIELKMILSHITSEKFFQPKNKLIVNKIEKRQSFKVSASKINRYVQTEEDLSFSDKEQENIELVKADVNIKTDEKFDTLKSKVKEKIEKFEQNLKADKDTTLKPIANIIYDSNEKEMENKVSLINIKSLFFISS